MSRLRFIPNLLTISRGLLCPVVVYLILHSEFAPGLILFFLTCFTDFLDGYLARRWHATSKLGRILDPISDKILTFSFFILLVTLDACPVWFLSVLIATTGVQGAGLLLVWLFRRPEDAAFTPLKLGKWNTTFQFVWIGVVFIELAFGSFSPGNHAIDRFFYLLLAAAQIFVCLSYCFRGRATLVRLAHRLHPQLRHS